MSRYKEIANEIEFWSNELTNAEDELFAHLMWADFALELGEACEAEIADEQNKIMERIDAAQSWIDELDAEVAELLAA